MRFTLETNDGVDVTWTSSDETIFSVNQAGVVVAKSEGAAIITATTSYGAYDECTVVVSKQEVHIRER